MRKLILLNLFIIITLYPVLAQKTKYAFEAKPFFKNQQEKKSSLLYNYNVQFYHLNIETDNTTDTITKGNVLIKAKVKQDNFKTFAIELVNSLTIDSIKVNGKLSSFSHDDDLISIPLETPLNQGETVEGRIYYHGETGSGMRLQTSSKWNKQVNYTLSESFHAKDWFPCKEILTDKADSAKIYVTTQKGLMVGSNGLLKDIDTLENNKVRFRWETKYPIDYYLISLAIGDFMEYSYDMQLDGGGSMLIQNYLYNDQECLDENKNVLDQTDDMIILLSDLFGPYPFKEEKYGHCMAPFGGGMEHQTMSTMGYFDFGITMHELGHQWFGDYVTCATWQDIWINEGFASYSEYLGEEFLHTQQKADEWMQEAHNYVLNEDGGSVYIPEEHKENESRIFDYRLSYKKGAAIVHQIRFELNNDDIFFKTLKDFLKEYADSAATGEDFRAILEKNSGKDFSAFFDQWYYGEGHPIISVEYYQPEKKDSLSLIVKQETSKPNVTPFFEMHTEFRIQHSDGDTLIRTYQQQSTDTFQIYMPHKVKEINIDPNNWIVNEKGTISESPKLSLGKTCVSKEPYELQAGRPKGGTYEGPGISNNIFNPAEAGLGKHTITYTYEDPTIGTCKVSDQIEIIKAPSVDLGKDQSITTDDTLQLEVEEGYAQYNWSNGDTKHYTRIYGSNLQSDTTYTYWVRVTGSGGCTTSDSLNIQVVKSEEDTTGSDSTATQIFTQQANNNWKIYPNPAKEKIYIKNLEFDPSGKGTINLFNNSGTRIKTVKIKDRGLITINCSNLVPGIYYVQLTVNGKKSTKKVLIE